MSGEITYANILPKTLPKYYYDNKWHTQTEFQEDKTGYGVYEKKVNLIFKIVKSILSKGIRLCFT